MNVLIIGATSDIAVEIARVHASRGDRLALVARNAGALDELAADLRVRGAAGVDVAVAEATIPARWDPVLADLLTSFAVERAYVAHGVLPNETAAGSNPAVLREALEVNATSAIAAVAAIAQDLERRGAGRIVVLSTAATDRARSSVAVYGAGKAALEYYARALALRWSGRSALGVTIVKPGRVATKMTAHLPRTLMAAKDAVAAAAVAAADRKATLAYAPRYWAFIMLVIRALPTAVLARLPL